MATENGGRPPLRKDEVVESHTLGFFRDQWAEITEAATETGKNISAWMREAADNELRRRDAKKHGGKGQKG